MRIGLIGYPVQHSASPRMQNAAFAAVGLTEWTYELWPTPLDALAERLLELRKNHHIGGCNVTIPHKQNVLGALDVLSDHARMLGAVNTIVKRDGQLIGHNTDWLGFLADLRFNGFEPVGGQRALVLGAGGSARGIVYALLKCGLRVHIVNRDAARAHSLAHDLHPLGTVSAITTMHQAGAIDLIINCTSAGMDPHLDTTPWPLDLPFPRQAFLYDLVYKPRQTVLIQQAEAAGARCAGGIGMLAEQGAAAFELWTGVPAAQVAPVMRAALG
ncbi:MAG: shikimate dehydrogenase [Chloroflexi bacterium]|nr:shikimate dehydrogenase [Chloroflexota bacterium]